MIKRFLIAVALLFPPWALAQCVDCADTAGYVEVTIPATKVDEAIVFGYLPMSKLPEGFHLALDAASDTTGATIRIETEDAGAECAVWVPSYNASTDEGAILWRLTGLSSSVDTTYRVHVVPGVSMYAASNTYGRNAVFSGYAGVYFPGVTLDDVTGNWRDLTAEGSPGTTAWLEGIDAATYNGSTQHHSYSGAQAVTNWPLTLEALAYTTSATTNQRAFSISVSTSPSSSAAVQFAGGLANDPYRGVIIGNAGSAAVPEINNYTTYAWHFVAVSRDANTGTTAAYINSSSATDSTTVNTPTAFDRLVIGSHIYSSGTIEKLTGRVGYAALTDSVRSAAYVSTMQRMWADPGFVDVGEWVEAGGGCVSGTTGWVLLQSAISSGTGEVWTNPTNVLVDDATYALADNVDGDGGTTQALLVTAPLYGVTIPSGADSYQASLRIKRSAQSGTRRFGADNNLRFVVGGAPTGSNMANATGWPDSPGTMDYGPVSFNESDLDEDFGFQLVAIADDRDDTDLFVYAAWVKIDWECPEQLGFPLLLILSEE